MTKEQLLVYLWSIYPDGGFLILWWVLFVVSVIILLSLFIVTIDNMDNNREESKKILIVLKKLVIVPVVLVVLILLSNLVPKREYFAYIIATPYIVDSGKSIIESLDDSNSKLFKLNQIMDKGLDKVIQNLAEKELKDK